MQTEVVTWTLEDQLPVTYSRFTGIVAWKSRQQPTVALSTTEAEYMASAGATQQATWLRLLLKDLQVGLPLNEPVETTTMAALLSLKTLFITSAPNLLQCAITSLESQRQHSSTQHLANMLTKSLPQATFDCLRELIEIGSKSI